MDELLIQKIIFHLNMLNIEKQIAFYHKKLNRQKQQNSFPVRFRNLLISIGLEPVLVVFYPVFYKYIKNVKD